MDLATRRKLYKACRDEPLDPKDPRRVDLDYSDGVPVRGVAWCERLATPIELSDEPTCQLVTGLPGSGKSTELRQLEVRLRGSAEAPGWVVARVDAEEAVDLTQPIDVPEILASVVNGVERAVLAAEGKKPDPASPGYLERLWTWLTKTDAELTQLTIGSGPAKLTYEMKTRPDFRQQVRASVSRNFARFLDDASAELKRLDQRAKATGRKGVCVVFDSLEKLRGLGENWLAVLESAERVFGGGAPYLHLPVHCLFTVPPALLNRLHVDVEFMPMVKLRERSGERFAPGCAALRELVRRRINDAELEALLGPRFETALGKLIDRTCGYPRELVKALTWLVELPRHPATESDLERLNNESRARYRSLVTDEDAPLLARLAVDKERLPARNEEDRWVIDRATQNSIVLRYLNEDEWWDLHPAVLDVPAIREAITALRSQRAG